MKAETVKIDKKDRRILSELEKNCRRPLGEIARAIGVSKQSLHYRIGRMERLGVISGFVAAVSFAKIGMVNQEAWICLQPSSKEKREKLVHDLKENPNVRLVGDCTGKFDMLVGILAENPAKFTGIFEKILRENPRCVKSHSYSISNEFYAYPKAHLAGNEGKKKVVAAGGEPKAARLDEADRNILSIVANDARVSVLEIAKKAGIAPKTARVKLKRLETEGVITGYTVIIDHEKIGMENFEILVNAESIGEKGEKELEEFLAHHQYSTFLLKCIGKWDLDIGFDARDSRHFQEILGQLRSRLGGTVLDYEVVNVLKWEKFTYYPFGKEGKTN